MKKFLKKFRRKKTSHKIVENQGRKDESKTITFPAEDIILASEYEQVKNCYVIGNTRFIISDHKKLFFSSNTVEGYDLKMLLQKWVLCEEDFGSCEYDTKSGKISFLINKSEKFLTGNTISAIHYEANNLYHFLIECLFDALMAYKKGIKIDNIIINHNLINRFQEILQNLFPKAKLIHSKIRQIIIVENLVLFGNRNSQWHWLRDKGELRNKDELKKRMFEGVNFLNANYLISLNNYLIEHLNIKAKKRNTSKSQIVFIIRKSSFRNTLNQEAICKFLQNKYGENHNLLIVDPASISLAKMGQILSGADILICQAGAALSNILLSNKKNIHVVTWRHVDKNQDSIYQKIIEILGHNYTELPALLCNATELKGDFAHHLASESQSDILAPIHLIDDFITKLLNSDKNRKI